MAKRREKVVSYDDMLDTIDQALYEYLLKRYIAIAREGFCKEQDLSYFLNLITLHKELSAANLYPQVEQRILDYYLTEEKS